MHILLLLGFIAQVYFINHAVKTAKPRYWIVALLIPLAGCLVYFFTEYLPEIQQVSEKDQQDRFGAPSSIPSEVSVGYISRGKLFHQSGKEHPNQIHSPFGQKMIDQAVRVNQSNDWKTKGSGSPFKGGMLWGVDNANADAIRVNITSVTKGREEGSLFYILESETTSGLFLYDRSTREEKRLFHKNHFEAKDLNQNPETGEFLCSQSFTDGTSNIVVMNEDGREMRTLTDGDSVDEAPAWIPGSERRLLFQSTGIARNSQGHAVGRGAASIQALDLDNGNLTGVLEDTRFDYLYPRIGTDGFLYFIRRPYEQKPGVSGLTVLFDFLLLPFRLLRAIFHYLNFFSLVYSQKPLTSATGPKVEGDDLKTLLLRGKVIDAEKALRKGAKIMGVPSLVPASWELVRKSTDGREEVVARHVAAFDVGADGELIYSNGCGVFTLDARGRAILMARDNIIEEVRWM